MSHRSLMVIFSCNLLVVASCSTSPQRPTPVQAEHNQIGAYAKQGELRKYFAIDNCMPAKSQTDTSKPTFMCTARSNASQGSYRVTFRLTLPTEISTRTVKFCMVKSTRISQASKSISKTLELTPKAQEVFEIVFDELAFDKLPICFGEQHIENIAGELDWEVERASW